MASDDHLAAGDAPGIDVTDLQMLGDPLELPFIEPCASRVRFHIYSPVLPATSVPVLRWPRQPQARSEPAELQPAWATRPPRSARHRLIAPPLGTAARDRDTHGPAGAVNQRR